MAATLMFLVLSALNAVAAQQSIIRLGSSLTPTTTSSWLSHSGQYAFGFYQQGNGYTVGVFLAGISGPTVVWTANRNDPPVPSNVTLLLTSQGTLILQRPQGQYTYIANISQPASSASMFDSGNFVLHNSDQEIIWQSFEHPTDTILPSQHLSPGQELFSSASETDHSTGIFRLKMQNDGNLVQYPVDTPDMGSYSYWASATVGQNCTLNLDEDGHLYLLNSNGNVITNFTQGDPNEENMYLMRIDADGIFRLYSHPWGQKGHWSAIWSSIDDKCVPKGLCGLNGFCVLNDTEANCRCPPGFEFVNLGNWGSGCERNFIIKSCKNKDDSIKYTMSPLNNTLWQVDSYWALNFTTEEECQEACLQDCNCEVALFKDGECRKLGLPLMYGRELLNYSTITYIKDSSFSPGEHDV